MKTQYICPVRTVADLVSNLMLMDQTLPIYGAQYIEHQGQRRCVAVPPTVSRERIMDSRWIGEGDACNAAVIWTRAEQPHKFATNESEHPEDRYVRQSNELDCPHCGGSGHKDDLKQQVKRNDPVSALAINWLVNVGAVSQEIADKAFSAACNAMEDEARRMKLEWPWVKRLPEEPAICGMCSYIGTQKDSLGQCPQCHWDELQPKGLSI